MLSVSLDQYQHILDHGLFHLKPEVRGPLHQVDFLPDLPILLELGLQPYIFRPYNHPTDPPESHLSPLAKDPITIAENERAIALLSTLLTIVENEHPTEKIDDIDTIPAPKPLDPKSSEFIQDLLGRPKRTHYESLANDRWMVMSFRSTTPRRRNCRICYPMGLCYPRTNRTGLPIWTNCPRRDRHPPTKHQRCGSIRT